MTDALGRVQVACLKSIRCIAISDGDLAEAAGQLVKMSEHRNRSQPYLVGARIADGTLYRYVKKVEG